MSSTARLIKAEHDKMANNHKNEQKSHREYPSMEKDFAFPKSMLKSGHGRN